MPIAKITKGKDAAGCLNYVLKKEKAQIIETNCLGSEPDVLATEFGIAEDSQSQTTTRKNTTKTVHHASIGLPIGLDLKPDEWSRVAKDYLKGMGFDPEQNQYVAAIHRDTDHQHLHLVVNRVRLDGTTTGDWKDWQRAEDVMRKLEKDYDLPSVIPSRDAQVKAPTVAEVRQSRATGQPILRQEMQQSIELAAKSVKSLPELQRSLKEVGIELTIRYRVSTNDGKKGDTTTPRLNLLFTSTHEGSGKEITFSASSLGKRYTAKGLQHNFGLGLEEGQQIGDAATQEAVGVSVAELIVNGAIQPLTVLVDEEKELQEEENGQSELKQGEKLEAETQKQFYQKLWTQIQRDVLKAGIPKEQTVPAVAVVALGRTFTHQQVAAIVAQSPEAKRKLKEKGRAELNRYLQTVVDQAEASRQSGRGVKGTVKDEGR